MDYETGVDSASGNVLFELKTYYFTKSVALSSWMQVHEIDFKLFWG